nr:RING-box protein 2 [Halyomorpha halys]
MTRHIVPRETLFWLESLTFVIRSTEHETLSYACLRCQAESKQDSRYGKQDCVVVWGDCNHSFHYCCMSLWVKQNNRCPLCQQEWSIQRMGK